MKQILAILVKIDTCTLLLVDYICMLAILSKHRQTPGLLFTKISSCMVFNFLLTISWIDIRRTSIPPVAANVCITVVQAFMLYSIVSGRFRGRGYTHSLYDTTLGHEYIDEKMHHKEISALYPHNSLLYSYLLEGCTHHILIQVRPYYTLDTTTLICLSSRQFSQFVYD